MYIPDKLKFNGVTRIKNSNEIYEAQTFGAGHTYLLATPLREAAPDMSSALILAERIFADYVEADIIPEMCAFAECLEDIRAAIAKAVQS